METKTDRKELAVRDNTLSGWSRMPTPGRLRRRGAEAGRPYRSSSDRPTRELMVRVGLWAALAIGCVGGIIALVRPSGDSGPPAEDPAADDWIVPAPVAGVAELAVEEWLTASEGERDQLLDLFVEAPTSTDRPGLGPTAAGGLVVERVVTVGGQRLADGYWAVTVMADLAPPEPGAEAATGDATTEPGATEPGEAGAAGGSSEDGATGQQTGRAGAGDGTGEPGDGAGPRRWFLEVGIVDDGRGGYVALTTPAVVPAPPADATVWRAGGSRQPREPDDPLARTVEQFLTALLAGEGDVAPYLAPGAEVEAASPPPFVEVTVEEMTVDDLGDGEVWVLAHVLATTPEGVRLPLTYDLVTVERPDRWEIASVAGAPTVIE